VSGPQGAGDSGSGLFPAGVFRDGRAGRRRGPSAGNGQAGKEEQPPSPDNALGGGRTLLIVHKPYQHYDVVPQLLAQLQDDTGGNLALGVSSWLPNSDPGAHRQFNSSCAAAEVRIVDPRAYLADGHLLRVKTPAAAAVDRAPYLRGGDFPVAGMLDAQRECGANLLLTPGRALDPSDPLRSLATASDEGDEALSLLKPGERLALNVTVNADWLRNPDLLDDLLAELIEMRQFGIWYVRVQWPSTAKSWHQPADETLLDGYKSLAAAAREQGRCLLLPQTGLTGWLALAWGAAGYGTGTSGSIQAFLRESDGGGGGGTQLERYFEEQLLHFVERTAHPALARDPAYKPCTCPYCASLFTAETWSHTNAGLHYLHAAGTLTAEVAPPGAAPGQVRDAVADKVRAAARFAQDKLLTGHSDPVHLDTWDQALSS
jgi:hypothetical protein